MSFFVLWNTTEDILKNVFVFWSIKCKLIKSKAVWIPMFFKYYFVFRRTKKNDVIEFSGHYLQTFSCFCFFFLWRTLNNSLVLFQTALVYFVLWSTNEDILKNVFVSLSIQWSPLLFEHQRCSKNVCVS